MSEVMRPEEDDEPDDKRPSRMESGDLVNKIIKDRANFATSFGEWRKEMRWSYRLVDSDQWTAEERSVLEEENRAPITFNRIGPMVDAVCGSQVNNRQEIRFLPRTLDDGGKAELWNGVVTWAMDQCDAEDETSEAFRDMTICGMGWTETRVDYTEDPEGRIVVERFDPGEAEWDPGASKKNLVDARWKARVKWMSEEDVESLWPDYDCEAAKANSGGGTQATKVVGNYDDENSGAGEIDLVRVGMVEVCEYQWRETEAEYVVADGQGGMARLSEEQWKSLGEKFGARLAQLPHAKRPRHKWFRVFVCGGQVLKGTGQNVLPNGAEPCPDEEASTFQCMTGRRDRNKRTWYGIVRAAEDPQRWANKWLTQALHIINTSAKSGVVLEEGATEDIRKFEETWAKPGGVTMVRAGAIAQGALQPKQPPVFPQGFDRLLQFAVASIPDVTGINKELLGLADREQAGVLEWQRKQAGQAVLAPLFDALRLYNKQQGRLMLRFVSKYVPPYRQIRVTDAENAAQVVQIANLPDAREYDVVVDQAPTAPNQKMEVWASLQQMLPALMKSGMVPPPVLLELLKFSPLPDSTVQAIQRKVQELQQQAPQVPPEVQKMQAEMQLKAQDQQMQAQLEQQKAEANLALKVKEAEIDGQIALSQAKMEMEIARQRAEQEMAMKEREAQQRLALSQQEMAMRNAHEERRTAAQEGAAKAKENASGPQIIVMGKDGPDEHQQMMAGLLEQLTKAMAAPRRQKIERGPDGRAVGVVSEAMMQ